MKNKIYKKDRKPTVLLYGPYVDINSSGSYGGGTGGYTRNMTCYINYFKPVDFLVVPSFHTFRGQLKTDNFIWRMLVDTITFIRNLLKHNPQIIHVFAQYRTATPREFMVQALSLFFRKSVVYELKAGAFISWYQSTNSINRYFISYIVRSSKKVLVEGLPYISFLKDEFQVDAIYIPNYMPSEIVPDVVSKKLENKIIRVLFVGYCYEGKGVYELVKGCSLAASKGVEIELTIVGQEHDDFKRWLNQFVCDSGLVITRLGRKDYADVLEEFKSQDVYCYPTSHNGEGHNNTINEAMMFGLVIITTKKGFLNTIITNERGYSLDVVSPVSIATAIINIDQDRGKAIQKAEAARAYLRENFTSDIIFPTLENVYKEVLKH